MSENEEIVPFQYKNNGQYIIIFSDSLEELNKIESYFKEKDQSILLVRGLEGKNNKLESTIQEYYMDELNEEDFIKNSKGIIYLYNYSLNSNNFINYVQDSNITFYISTTFEKEKYESDLQNKDLSLYKSYTNKNGNNNNNNEETPSKIKIEEKKKEMNNENQKLHLLTYIRRMEGNDQYYQLQIKCVLENYKNNFIQDMIVVGKNIEETFRNIHFDRIEGKRLILINDDDDNITFYDMFLMANEIFKDKMVILMRSDIILLQTQSDLLSLYFMYLTESKMMWGMSRIERETSGRLIRMPPQNSLFESMSQDAWIFKTPIINEQHELITKYDFNEIHSELYMNTYMKEKGYKIQNNINDFKIIRLCLNDNFVMRDLMKSSSTPLLKDKITVLPELGLMGNVSFESLFQMFNLTDEEIYQYKLEFMNNIIKRKMFGN